MPRSGCAAPRNNFSLEPAPRYRFVAGGIGITPILPMLAAAEASAPSGHCSTAVAPAGPWRSARNWAGTGTG
ncbi:hypothetical protein GCM10011428_26570 [Streptomyces violaceus]